MVAITLPGTYGADVRPARVAAGRKPWAKDPTAPGETNGTRLDATFVNDWLGLVRHTFAAAGVVETAGDDSLLTSSIEAIVAATAPAAHTHDDRYYTKSQTDSAIAALVDSSPSTLDTLNELAAALGDDPNFAASTATSIGLKAAKSANLSDLADVSAALTNLGLSANAKSFVTAANYAAMIALLPVATTSLKGLVPPPGTATGKVLQDDLTWVTPAGAGSGSPGGVTGELQFNAAGLFGGAAALAYAAAADHLTITALGPGYIPLILKLAASQTADGLKLVDNANASLWRVLPNGEVRSARAGGGGAVTYGDLAGTTGVSVRSGAVDVAIGGGGGLTVSSSLGGVVTKQDYGIGWGNSTQSHDSSAIELALWRDASNAIAQRAGSAAQTYRIYNTFTDPSNYERGTFNWVSNSLRIGTQNAGTGVARAMDFMTGGTRYFSLATDGHLKWITDNANDIGATGAKPRDLYIGRNLGLGVDPISSAFAALAAGTTAKAVNNWASGVAPTAPNNGDEWYNGTNKLFRISGVNYGLLKTVTIVPEVIGGGTLVTDVIASYNSETGVLTLTVHKETLAGAGGGGGD